ncbi:hypothetical protein ACI65C_005049 [Semiaphis heraclei]
MDANTNMNDKKRGRKPAISPEIVFEALSKKNHMIFIGEKLKPVSDKIWTELSFDIENKITPNSLYICVYQNRYGWKNRLRDLCGIQNSPPTVIHNKDSESSNYSDTEPEGNRIDFYFTIPYDKYSDIIPCTTRYKKKETSRSYSILKQYAWADVINDAFIKKHNLPCNYIYKRAKVSMDINNAKYFIKFQAKCKDCNEDLFGWCYKKPENLEPLEVHILTKDTRGEERNHLSKRPLMGSKRLKIGEELATDIPANWRRKNTKDMEFDCVSPPNLYTNNVLSKAKQNYTDNLLKIPRKNVLESLVELKHTLLAGNIHNIGCDPLYVHYWTNHQLLIYRDLRKEYCRLSVDATGSLVKKLKRTSLNLSLSGDIFLYEAVVSQGFGHFPVSQMISERHDTTAISFWLDMWIKSGANPPNEAVSDYSKALLGAMCKSFCSCDLRTYVKKSFLNLSGSTCDIPPCFIRIDVSHMIKLFCRLKILNGIRNKRLKEFYVRGFRLLLTSTTLEMFKQILKSLMTVILSPTDGYLDESNTKPNSSESCRIFLLSLMKNSKPYDNYNTSDELEIQDLENVSIEFDENPITIYEQDEVKIFINQVENESNIDALVEGNRESAYYLPGLMKDLKRYCYDFPLWTGVMIDKFKSPYVTATSSSVENDFNKLKNEVLRFSEKPMTADRFVIRHVQSINEHSKLFRSKQIRFTHENEKTKNTIHRKASSDGNGNGSSDHNDSDNVFDYNEGNLNNNDYGDSDEINNDLESNVNKESDFNSENENDSSSFVSSNDDIENWRGKGKNPNTDLILPKRKKKSSKYMDPTPEIERILNKSLRSKHQTLLINGNMKTPIKINKKRYLVSNTCAFDSVCIILAMAYTDSKHYQEYMKKSSNELLLFCEELAKNGPSSIIYKQRLSILKTIFNNDSGLNDIVLINAECNVLHIINVLLKNIPSATQMITCSNHSCVVKEFGSPTIIVKLSNNFLNLQKDLKHYCKEITIECTECGHNAVSKRKLHEHLFIETDMYEALTMLTDFPLEVEVNNVK